MKLSRFRACLVCILAFVAQADLELELYLEARRSPRLVSQAPDAEALAHFLGPGRPGANVMVMFHDETCNICRRALVEFERVAAKFKGRPIVFAHVDCTHDKSPKDYLRLGGFPSVRFWRARDLTLAGGDAEGEAESEEYENEVKALVGKRVRVDSDVEFILRASRQAGMNEAKDIKRRQAAGLVATLVQVDVMDVSAEVEVGGVLGKVWLPMEALRHESGESLPFRRSDAAVPYRHHWNHEELSEFAERLLRPLVGVLDDVREVPERMKGDPSPCIIFCGQQVPRGFVQALIPLQATTSAFHATSPSTCPVPEWPAVVVFSSPSQQWSADKFASAAVAVARAKIVANDTDLFEWVSTNRFPGLMHLGYHNFQDFINAGRRGMMVAIDVLRGSRDMNRLVERRLLEVANPLFVSDKVYEFTFGKDNMYVGVADASLEGMSSFGVHSERLPRVLIFEGSTQWVEDEEELTVERLSSDLSKVPVLWRMGSSPRHQALWFARECIRTYKLYDRMAGQAAGELGRVLLHAALAGLAALQVKMMVDIAVSLKTALLGEAETATTSASSNIKSD